MNARPIAAGLSTIGVLVLMAGVFSLLPMNVALFAAVACFIVAGAVPMLLRKADPVARSLPDDRT